MLFPRYTITIDVSPPHTMYLKIFLIESKMVIQYINTPIQYINTPLLALSLTFSTFNKVFLIGALSLRLSTTILN